MPSFAASRHLANENFCLFVLFCLIIEFSTCCQPALFPLHIMSFGDVRCAQQVESTPKEKAAESEAAAAAAREAQMRAQQENQRRKEKAAERKQKANQKKKAREAEIKAQEAAAKAEVTTLLLASAVAVLPLCCMGPVAIADNVVPWMVQVEASMHKRGCQSNPLLTGR